MQYWFTSDEHYGHANIITFCNRPFANVDEMNQAIITNHNAVVQDTDLVTHCGDFTLSKTGYAIDIIRQLKGNHIFVKGSHDKWMKNFTTWSKAGLVGYLLEEMIEDTYVVACHYAMRVWPRSHYGSIQVYGHSHSKLPPVGKQLDVGVDSHNFFPIRLQQIIETINLNQGVSHDQASPPARV